MHTERQVRLFRNGRNQAVRIPREFEFDVSEVIMRREDHRLVIEPVRRKGLLTTLSNMPNMEDSFPDIDEDLQALDETDL
jgi:antitoxin VapB